MSIPHDPARGIPGTSDEIDPVMDGAADGMPEGRDPEALSHEREEYPDPGSYPSPEEGEKAILDGSTPDADLRVDGEQT